MLNLRFDINNYKNHEGEVGDGNGNMEGENGDQ